MSERLWRGSGARWKAVAAGALAGPAVLTAAVWLIALAVGLQRDYDGPRVMGYVLRSTAGAAFCGSWTYGVPVFLALARFGRAGLLPIMAAGAVPGAAVGAWVAAGPGGEGALLAGAAMSTCGAVAAGVSCLVTRRLDRR